jgi:hypothetical protein
MSSPENALVQADKSKIDDGHPSGQNDWGVAALFNMITPHFFEYPPLFFFYPHWRCAKPTHSDLDDQNLFHFKIDAPPGVPGVSKTGELQPFSTWSRLTFLNTHRYSSSIRIEDVQNQHTVI